MKKLFGLVLLAVGLTACSGEEDPPPYTPPAQPATCTSAENGNTRCVNTSLQTCNGSTWGSTANCTTTQQVCVETSQTTAACQTPLSTTCTAGETGNQRCNGTTVQTCNGTDWTTSDTCVSPEVCTTVSTTVAECAAADVCSGTGTGEHYVCNGAVVQVCEDNAYAGDLYDCADLMGDGSVPAAVCYDYGGTWEADCLAAIGNPCFFLTQQGGAFVWGCGSGTPSLTAGCDVAEGCVTGQTQCTPAQEFVPVCGGGNRLVVDCADLSSVKVPLLINCASEENGFGTCTGNICRHSTTGGPCHPALMACDGGLTCSSTTEWGTCET